MLFANKIPLGEIWNVTFAPEGTALACVCVSVCMCRVCVGECVMCVCVMPVLCVCEGGYTLKHNSHERGYQLFFHVQQPPPTTPPPPPILYSQLSHSDRV